jgi:hypothetical protein
MQQSGSTSKDEKLIEQWSKEDVFQWLEKYFPTISKLLLEEGVTGEILVHLATTGTNVLKELVPNINIRLKLIDMIDKQQKKGIFTQNSHFGGTIELSIFFSKLHIDSNLIQSYPDLNRETLSFLSHKSVVSI